MLVFAETKKIALSDVSKVIVHSGWIKIKAKNKNYKILFYNDSTLPSGGPKAGGFGVGPSDVTGEQKQKSRSLLNILRNNNVKTKNRIPLNLINISLAIVFVVFMTFLLVMAINFINANKT